MEQQKTTRTNWKQLAQELGEQLQKLTNELSLTKEEVHLNEHEAMEIASQRDQLEAHVKKQNEYIDLQQEKLHAASHVINLQKDLQSQFSNLLVAANNINSIASNMITIFASQENLIKNKED